MQQSAATYIKTTLQLVCWMGVQSSAGATKALKAMCEGVPPKFTEPTKLEMKKEVKKDDRSVITRDLEKEEYNIEMEMYFYKYKRHLQAIMDWEISNKKIFILFLQHCPLP